MRVPLAIGVLIAIVLTGCTGGASPAPTGPGSPVEGVVLSIDSGGLTDVRGFTLRTGSGQVLSFKLGTLENPTQFAPGHLADHEANALPVRVYFVSQDGALVVYRLEDAPKPSSS